MQKIHVIVYHIDRYLFIKKNLSPQLKFELLRLYGVFNCLLNLHCDTDKTRWN